jgi:hypothetical protein
METTDQYRTPDGTLYRSNKKTGEWFKSDPDGTNGWSKIAPSEVPKDTAPISKGNDTSGDLTPEAIRDLAVRGLYDPSAVSGWGRDTRTKKAIQNEQTRIARESGITPNDIVSGQAGFKADRTSLNKLVPQYDAVTAFEQTAVRNGDRLLQLADQVDATGIPVIEKWIRAGRQASGDPTVAAFNAQMLVYRTEAAKILTNPNLTGQLTDSARREVEEFMKGGSSAKQIRAVVELLKNDFENRKSTLEHQIATIRERMKGRMPGPESEKAAATALGGAPPAAQTPRIRRWNPATQRLE